MAKKKAKKTKKTKKKKPPYLLLLPYKGVMYKALKKKGVKIPNKKLKTIADLFFENIVRKHNLEDNMEEHFIGEAIGLIRDIINFIKNIFKKKEGGQKISQDLHDIADDVAKVDTKLKEAKIDPSKIVDEDGNTSDGKKVLPTTGGDIKIGTSTAGKLPMPLILAGAAAVAFFALRK